MGMIEIEGMEFYAYHGHFAAEQVVGNRFIVDLRLVTECSEAAKNDDLNDALDYQIAYMIVKEEMQIKSHLLENVAGRILDRFGKEFTSIEKIRIKISKLNPPMGGQIEKVSVTLER
jgi:7,8-dihydroneopterin aldolase/epimerase/oxygenase